MRGAMCTKCDFKGIVFLYNKKDYGTYAFSCDSCNIAAQKGLSKRYVRIEEAKHKRDFTFKEPDWFNLPGRFKDEAQIREQENPVQEPPQA